MCGSGGGGGGGVGEVREVLTTFQIEFIQILLENRSPSYISVCARNPFNKCLTPKSKQSCGRPTKYEPPFFNSGSVPVLLVMLMPLYSKITNGLKCNKNII